jgi:hypothetical protein
MLRALLENDICPVFVGTSIGALKLPKTVRGTANS